MGAELEWPLWEEFPPPCVNLSEALTGACRGPPERQRGLVTEVAWVLRQGRQSAEAKAGGRAAARGAQSVLGARVQCPPEPWKRDGAASRELTAEVTGTGKVDSHT